MPVHASPPIRRSLPIEGMHCAGCASTVAALIERQDAVDRAHVSVASHRAEIVGDVSLASLDAALQKGGYRIGRRETSFSISPASSVSSIEAIEGVDHVTRDGEVVRVHHVDDPSVLNQLREFVVDPSSFDTGEDPRERLLYADSKRWFRSMCIALPIALFLIARSVGLFDSWSAISLLSDPRLAFLLACVAVFVAGAPILLRAFQALRARRATMDVLVAIGALAALAYATLLWQRHGSPKFLDAPAVIVALVCLGRLLESRAARASGDAVGALLRLAPESALLVDPEQQTQRIGRSKLLPGDVVRVLPGARIPPMALSSMDRHRWMSRYSPVNPRRLQRTKVNGSSAGRPTVRVHWT